MQQGKKHEWRKTTDIDKEILTAFTEKNTIETNMINKNTMILQKGTQWRMRKIMVNRMEK